MSEKGAITVSSGAVRAEQARPAPREISDGKAAPDAGKVSPAQAVKARASSLKALVRELNTITRSISPALRFQVDIQSGSSVIQVFNRETGELIRQIPPERANAIARNQGTIDLQRVDDLV